MRAVPWIQTLLLTAGLFAATVVRAEHTPDHRYIVEGMVADDRGRPMCFVTVRAADVTQPSPDSNRTGETDANGRYRIQLHMHDFFDLTNGQPRASNNVGDLIRVTLEGTNLSQVVVAVSNSANPDAWGQQTVDFPSVEGLRNPCGASVEGHAPISPSVGAAGALFAGIASGVLVAGILLRLARKDSRRRP